MDLLGHAVPLLVVVAREVGDVLVEDPTEGDVEDLVATTDAENRQVVGQCHPHQRQFESVPVLVDSDRLGRHRGAVGVGIDVASARQQHTVETVDQRPHHLERNDRQQHRNTTSGDHCVDVRTRARLEGQSFVDDGRRGDPDTGCDHAASMRGRRFTNVSNGRRSVDAMVSPRERFSAQIMGLQPHLEHSQLPELVVTQIGELSRIGEQTLDVGGVEQPPLAGWCAAQRRP